MIAEDEAFWAGIAVATMMLGGGFSMLFLRALTGEGAVVLSLGLMTMALTIQLRAKPRRYIEGWNPFESRVATPTPPLESPTEPEQTQAEAETKTEQQPSQPQEVSEPNQQPQPDQPQPPEQPQAQPEPPVEEKKEPPEPEKREEEPIVVF